MSDELTMRDLSILLAITSLDISSWDFICEGLTHSLSPGVHVTSDVIMYHCSAGHNRTSTYVIT